MPAPTIRERRLSLEAGVSIALACVQAADAFVPSASVGGLVRSRSSESLHPSILRASAAPGGTSPLPPVQRMLRHVSSPAVSVKLHLNVPTKGFFGNLRQKFSPVMATGTHFFQEEDVQKEFLENSVDSFVGKP